MQVEQFVLGESFKINCELNCLKFLNHY